MSYGKVVLGIGLAMLCLRPVTAQEPDIDLEMMCNASAAAYQAYALDNDGPDKGAATARVAEGVIDYKNRNCDEGLRKTNEGTAMIHDHLRTRRM